MMGAVVAAYAQPGVKKPATKTPVKAPVTPAPVLKTLSDTISYILGESAAYNMEQMGFNNVKLNMSLYTRGMNDVRGKKKPLIDDAVANATMNRYYMKTQEEKCRPTIIAGEEFLAKNKLRPGVKTTASGLQYEVIAEGTGPKMQEIDTFVCHYRGTLIDGTEFDASYNRGQPLVMPARDVIPGWTEALTMMPVGSKYKIYVPYQLGYGIAGQGQIPGGAVLIFEMELLDFKKLVMN